MSECKHELWQVTFEYAFNDQGRRFTEAYVVCDKCQATPFSVTIEFQGVGKAVKVTPQWEKKS
jgi:hypothetical protein